MCGVCVLVVVLQLIQLLLRLLFPQVGIQIYHTLGLSMFQLQMGKNGTDASIVVASTVSTGTIHQSACMKKENQHTHR